MSLNVVKLPSSDLGDIPRGLRAIADQIESGEFGDARNMAFVLDCGDSTVTIGLLGLTPEPVATGHLLFALAQRKLETTAMERA